MPPGTEERAAAAAAAATAAAAAVAIAEAEPEQRQPVLRSSRKRKASPQRSPSPELSPPARREASAAAAAASAAAVAAAKAASPATAAAAAADSDVEVEGEEEDQEEDQEQEEQEEEEQEEEKEKEEGKEVDMEELRRFNPTLWRRLKRDYELQLSRLSVSDYSFSEIRSFLEEAKGWDWIRGRGVTTWIYRTPAAIRAAAADAAAARASNSNRRSRGGPATANLRPNVDFFKSESDVMSFLARPEQKQLRLELFEFVFAVHRRGVLADARRQGQILGSGGDPAAMAAALAAEAQRAAARARTAAAVGASGGSSSQGRIGDEDEAGEEGQEEAFSAINRGAQAYFDSRAGRKSKLAKGAIASSSSAAGGSGSGTAVAGKGGRGRGGGKQRKGRQTKYSRAATLDRVLEEAVAAAGAVAAGRTAPQAAAGAAAAQTAAVAPAKGKGKAAMAAANPDEEASGGSSGDEGGDAAASADAAALGPNGRKQAWPWPPRGLLPMPRARREEMIRQRAADNHPVERAGLLQSYEGQFTRWHTWLLAGHSVLFHGVGSKKELLCCLGSNISSSDVRDRPSDSFAALKMGTCGGPVAYLPGYDPAVCVRKMLDTICDKFGLRAPPGMFSPSQSSGTSLGKSKNGPSGPSGLADTDIVKYAENVAAVFEAANSGPDMVNWRAFSRPLHYRLLVARTRKAMAAARAAGAGAGAGAEGWGQQQEQEQQQRPAKAAVAPVAAAGGVSGAAHAENNPETREEENNDDSVAAALALAPPAQRAAAVRATAAFSAKLPSLSGRGGGGNGGPAAGSAATAAGAGRRRWPRLPQRFFLFIHSIDGEKLRDPESQRALAALASCRCIHVAASVDHVNATLLWDDHLSQQFGWLRAHTPTFAPMLLECGGLGSGMAGGKSSSAGSGGGGDDQNESSVAPVLLALGQRQLELLQLVGDWQLKHLDREVPGIPMLQLERECKHRGIVQRATQLEHLSTDLRDHRLLASKMHGEEEIVCIPRPRHVIDEVLAWTRQAH